ncbi:MULTISPECIES: LysR family transcriptional regulator substrate-binding protein [unclassified Adlercreutzia]|uniref:LysR family transcriptional regulator substrate-binding protein n=1 Tax=unclassified Adlercreutzia TaxID=2636013 RepID=UPI0013E9F863|nr:MULTISPECIES: LysR family transcriptional regulator substrate-binding protein [unclassified Adlercreutzia]
MSVTFSISQQHYLFSVQAFAHTILSLGGDEYSYALRDRTTAGVLEDVANGTSELGVIVQTSDTAAELDAAIADAGLQFVKLAESAPRVALPVSHPLSNASKLSLNDLSGWPYICFDQGDDAPLAFAEEALAGVARNKVVKCTDRASLSELATALNGYTVTSGILVGIADGSSLTTVELETDVKLHLGYVCRTDEPLSETGHRYVDKLTRGLALYARS